MNWKLLISGSLRMMLRFKMRTLFMSIGVALGVAVLIAGRSLGIGAEQQLNERIDLLFGPGTILLVSSLDFEDMEAIKAQVPGIVAFDPVLNLGELDISGGGVNRNFTVRRIASHGVGVERTFLIHSPRLEKVEVLRHGHHRRAKLYFLRERTGRATRLREKRY